MGIAQTDMYAVCGSVLSGAKNGGHGQQARDNDWGGSISHFHEDYVGKSCVSVGGGRGEVRGDGGGLVLGGRWSMVLGRGAARFV